MEKPTQPPRLWLTRDETKLAFYNVHAGKPDGIRSGGYWENWLFCMPAQSWEAMFPALRLAPGEGPVEIELHATIIEKKGE